MEEAGVLYKAGHYARTYYLAEAAIEEIGKAAIAHFAKSRDLSSGAVCARIRIEFESHTAKINHAFMASIQATPPLSSTELRARVTMIADYASALRHGREAALYSDLLNDGSTRTPKDAVGQLAARDCVRLAIVCITQTNAMLLETPRAPYSTSDDVMYSLGNKVMRVWQERDFGEYLLDQIETRGTALSVSEALTTYRDTYLLKNRKFKSADPTDSTPTPTHDVV